MALKRTIEDSDGAHSDYSRNMDLKPKTEDSRGAQSLGHMFSQSTDSMQAKIMTRWVAKRLSKIKDTKHQELNSILTDSKDGLLVLSLLKSIRAKDPDCDLSIFDPPEPKPKNVFQCMANINHAFKLLETSGVSLIGIIPDEIYKVYIIIFRWQNIINIHKQYNT